MYLPNDIHSVQFSTHLQTTTNKKSTKHSSTKAKETHFFCCMYLKLTSLLIERINHFFPPKSPKKH